MKTNANYFKIHHTLTNTNNNTFHKAIDLSMAIYRHYKG